jgi:hypothetical protein
VNKVDTTGLEGEKPPPKPTLGGTTGAIPRDGGNTHFTTAPKKNEILKGLPFMREKDCRVLPKDKFNYGIGVDDW